MKVLIVDDDLVVGDLMRRVLEADGYEVAVAPSLAAARDAAGPFEAIIADVRLPNGDGRHLRDTYPETPFISMSGHHGEIPDLPKPFTPALLRATVRRAIHANTSND